MFDGKGAGWPGEGRPFLAPGRRRRSEAGPGRASGVGTAYMDILGRGGNRAE
jgi:hypothetical protein